MITIDDFPVDAAVRETHQYPSEVTSHPVEDEADFTDHVLNRPTTLIVEGIVSDTPIGVVASLRGDGALPSDDALAKLLEIRGRREPIRIVSSLGIHDNMVMQSLVIPRTAATGDALRFTATFRQIQLVTNERTTVPVDPPRAAREVRRGSKASKSEKDTETPISSEKQQEASILYQGVTKLRSIF